LSEIWGVGSHLEKDALITGPGEFSLVHARNEREPEPARMF